MYPNPILGSLESTWDRFGEKFPVFLVVQFSGNIGQHVFFQTFSIWSVPDMSVFEALRVYIRYVHGFSISIELEREGGVEGTGGNPSLQVLLVLPKRIFLARASSCRSRTAALQCSGSDTRISFSVHIAAGMTLLVFNGVFQDTIYRTWANLPACACACTCACACAIAECSTLYKRLHAWSALWNADRDKAHIL